MQIAQFLTSIRDARNHCVPVYEILSDPYDPQRALMVMPYLRPCNNPDFATLGDVIDFVDQTIEVSCQTPFGFRISSTAVRDSSSCTNMEWLIGKNNSPHNQYFTDLPIDAAI